MSDDARARALASACDLMAERYRRELSLKLEAQRGNEAQLRETEHAIQHVSVILPQSTCTALRRMAALQQTIAAGSADIALLRQTVIKWAARRDMLAGRARDLETVKDRRLIEEEIFEGLGRGKSEASS